MVGYRITGNMWFRRGNSAISCSVGKLADASLAERTQFLRLWRPMSLTWCQVFPRTVFKNLYVHLPRIMYYVPIYF